MAFVRRMMTPLEKALAVNAYAVDKVKIEIIAKALCRSRSTIYTVLKSRKVIRKTGPIPNANTTRICPYAGKERSRKSSKTLHQPSIGD